MGLKVDKPRSKGIKELESSIYIKYVRIGEQLESSFCVIDYLKIERNWKILAEEK